MDCRLITCVIGLFLTPLCAVADIYVDHQQGQTLFSDIPTAESERLQISTQPYRYLVRLKRVIDGDTIVLMTDEKVRLIGLNTPEIKSRYHSLQRGGEEAKVWLEQRLAQGELYIEYDVEQYDKYQRLLAHLFLDNQHYINAEILQAGMAVLTLTPPNLRYQDKLIQAQLIASQNKLGVWSYSDYQLQTQQDLLEHANTGIWQRWQVKIKAIKPTKKYIHLMITDKHFISIAKKHLNLFPDLETYRGKMVEVRGWLSKRNEQYVINVQHPSALVAK